jgi:hypothetical protein
MRLTIRASEAIEANLDIDESDAIAAKAENSGRDEIDAHEIPGRSFPGPTWRSGDEDSIPPHRIPRRERSAKPPSRRLRLPD